MTEFEKSMCGLPHIFNEEMMLLSKNAGILAHKYNQTDEDDEAGRRDILSKLLKQIGDNVVIVPDFNCEYGMNITIGNDVFINANCMLMDNAEISIGDQVLFGPNVSLYTVNHSIDPDERTAGYCITKPIHIGNRVWLSGDVKITAGVTIGDDSVIGAGSVVTKSIPSGVIAAGNPCRVIRKIAESDKLCLRNAEKQHR